MRDALRDGLSTIAEFVPKLALFLVILVIGIIIAKLIAKALNALLERTGFDRAVERGGIEKALSSSKMDASDIVAKLIYYTLLLFVLQLAFGVFGANPISRLIEDVIRFLPSLVVAIIILVVAASIAAAVKGLLENMIGGLSYGRALANDGLLDVALVVNDGPELSAAAVLTENRIKAAPVKWTQNVVRDGMIRAVVTNSGGANACTGRAGRHRLVPQTPRARRQAARSVRTDEVAVCSTGLIGVRLPMERLLDGLRSATTQLSADGGESASRAILTTDTKPKTAVHSVGGVTVSGMAKGAGMLAPSLATMLVVLTTDAQVAPAALDAAVRSVTSVTFDRLDSDGCMSTNDTVLAMASGASGVMVGRDLHEPEFVAALTEVCHSLAQQLLADAEGASKQIEIRVTDAASETDAVEVGRAIARSNLFKCAIHGEDPNWGRVLAAAGTTSADFDPNRLTVSMNGVTVCEKGSALAEEPKVDLTGRQVVVEVSLGAGSDQATIWTNDLTAAYVHENSAYST